jgi:hypothetical protein
MMFNMLRTIILLIVITFCLPALGADDETATGESTGESQSDLTEQQETREENWYGTLERFNKHPIQVKYRIKQQASGATNAELIINKESFALDDFTRGELDNAAGKFVRFSFKPGGIKEVECLLTLSDSESEGYSGLCPPDAAFDATGVRRLTMHRALGETQTGDAASKDNMDTTDTGDNATP